MFADVQAYEVGGWKTLTRGYSCGLLRLDGRPALMTDDEGGTCCETQGPEMWVRYA